MLEPRNARYVFRCSSYRDFIINNTFSLGIAKNSKPTETIEEHLIITMTSRSNLCKTAYLY